MAFLEPISISKNHPTRVLYSPITEELLFRDQTVLRELQSKLKKSTPGAEVSGQGPQSAEALICEPEYYISYLSNHPLGFPNYMVECNDKDSQFQSNLPVSNHVLTILQEVLIQDPKNFTGMTNRPVKMKINSPYLRHVLESLGPISSDSTIEGPVEISEPYPTVIHHLDQLHQYEQNHLHKDDLDITLRHIDTLLRFIDTSMGKDLRAEALLKEEKPPLVTYKWLWTIFEENTMVYSASKEQAYVLESITGGGLTSSQIPKPAAWSNSPFDLEEDNIFQSSEFYVVIAYNLVIKDAHCFRQKEKFTIRRFTGTISIASLPVFPLQRAADVGKELYQSLIERGIKTQRIFQKVPCHKEYDGWSLGYQARKVT
jgi:hypothetical protein